MSVPRITLKIGTQRAGYTQSSVEVLVISTYLNCMRGRKAFLDVPRLAGTAILMALIATFLFSATTTIVDAHKGGKGFEQGKGGKGKCKYTCQDSNTSGGGATGCKPANSLLDAAAKRPAGDKKQDAISKADQQCHSDPCGKASFSGAGGGKGGSADRCGGGMGMGDMGMGGGMPPMIPMIMPPMMMMKMEMMMPMMMEKEKKDKDDMLKCLFDPTHPDCEKRGTTTDRKKKTKEDELADLAGGEEEDTDTSGKAIWSGITSYFSGEEGDVTVAETDTSEDETVEYASAQDMGATGPSKLALPDLQPSYVGGEIDQQTLGNAQQAISVITASVFKAAQHIQSGATDMAQKLLDGATVALQAVTGTLVEPTP